MEKKQITLTQTALIVRVGAIVIMAVCAGMLLAYLLFSRPKPKGFGDLAIKQSGPVELGAAQTSLDAYRKPDAMENLNEYWKGKISGITHDTAKFAEMYETVFLRFARTHTPWEDCIWQLGLYPNIVYPDGEKKPRLNIYFIPTMKDTTKQFIYDYYDVVQRQNSPYKTSINTSMWRNDESYIFDQGTLFP